MFASHILFPVDFSERSRAVRHSVVWMAQHFRAKVTLIHTVDFPLVSYRIGSSPAVFDVDAFIEDANAQLTGFLGTTNEAVEVNPVVVQGDPAECIVNFAEHHGVGMIMMPTHGYGKFRSLLLGSVTAKVLHDAKCAVWTSAHTEDSALACRGGFKSILCAVDLAPESAGLICYAATFARSFGAQLRVVHAVSFAETQAQAFPEYDCSQGLFEMSRATIAERQKEAGIEAPVFLEVGSAANVVRTAAREFEADLVIIGRGKMHETLGRLRSNAYAIIRDSPCPVISA
jgi:nucleotide-binding universal stress UspA family protein